MLLTITSTHRPATDLGYLLVKHPKRCQTFPLSYGSAHVFYPEASPERCTAALLLDFDPVGLVQGRHRRFGEPGTLAHYVNDRPYVASSFLSVAIAQVFGSALQGRCPDRPELVDKPLPLEVSIPVVPCRGGQSFLRHLFEPLGYRVSADKLPLDELFPEWGKSPYLSVVLEGTLRLKDLLGHLYVLLPVLDKEKHYGVGQEELEKLLTRGKGWLATHPARDEIAGRYLKYQRPLVREALARLVEDEEVYPEEAEREENEGESDLEETLALNERRLGAVVATLKEAGVKRVLDIGCGEGRLLQKLIKERQFDQVAGMDVSIRALENARDWLNLERLPDRQRSRLKLFQGSLTYRDKRLEGYDAACLLEVIEHLEPSRLPAFERVVFQFARPEYVILTTPNREYNVRFANLPAGKLRHRDHRFEWTRHEFQQWAHRVAQQYAYKVRFVPVGLEDPEVGPPTQMGVFSF